MYSIYIVYIHSIQIYIHCTFKKFKNIVFILNLQTCWNIHNF